MLNPSKHWLWNLIVVAGLALVYGAVFYALYPYLAFAGAPFAAITVLVGAWRFGPLGGLLTSVFIAVENLLILRLIGETAIIEILKRGTLFGFIALLVMGVVVGRMGDLDRKVKKYAFELQHQAFHDSLTGLPNRALFSDRLEHATARAIRGGSSVAVLFLDLDGFKRINDLHGHATGDLLLRAVSGRIQDTVRAGDTVARLGGDEFVVLIEDIEGLDTAQMVADRLTTNLARPFIMNDMVYTISVSIGVSYCPTGESLSGDLLREADRAMYKAKSAGTGRYEIFQPMVA